MTPTARRWGGWLYRRAENVLAAMLALMFFSFLLQIFFRYVLNWPTGWTNELSAILWIWIVLWGAAFVLTEQEEMRFDLIYASVGPRTRGVMFFVFAASLVFNYVVTVENIPHSLSVLLTSWELSPIGFLLLVNVILLLLGSVLEGTTIILVILPVFIPTANALGIDLVHFGVMCVVNIMLGLVTPPYGLLLFIMTRIANVPLRDIVRDVLPFLYTMVASLLVITFFPDTVLWLPRLFGYQG